MTIKLTPTTLSIHVLNVGNGDSIIVELPELNGERAYIVVDSKRIDKTVDYLSDLGAKELRLVISTHPHTDHFLGLTGVLKEYDGKVDEFWDSGFRSVLQKWSNLLNYLIGKPEIYFLRPTSGLSTVLHGVELTVLAPSIALRNRYDSYGVNINNSSIVLKLEYGGKVMIISGDAQWESWGKMTEEFPHFEKTVDPRQHVTFDEDYNPLNCDFLKVPHHGSKHGTALEAIERISPSYTAISCMWEQKKQFPHKLAVDILKEEGSEIFVTENNGTIVYAVDDQGCEQYEALGDKNKERPKVPDRVP
jgi:beta-lactamase superfamily II metal-dependent hydrolase